jgi:hypothetical protein
MRRRGNRLVRKGAARPDKGKSVAGPSTNPATNLLIADIAMRGVAILMRRSAERGLLRGRFGPGNADDIVKGRSISAALVTGAAARVATRSVPGFLLVSGGLLAKAVIDRSMQRRSARRAGDEALLEQAENAPD